MPEEGPLQLASDSVTSLVGLSGESVLFVDFIEMPTKRNRYSVWGFCY